MHRLIERRFWAMNMYRYWHALLKRNAHQEWWLKSKAGIQAQSNAIGFASIW